MAAIGIVIVTYNSAAEIGPCLDAAMRTDAEIVVVDNASGDATLGDRAPRGTGNRKSGESRLAPQWNQGFTVLNTTYVLLLNPDLVLTGLGALREACDLPGSAGAGGSFGRRRATADQFMVPAVAVRLHFGNGSALAQSIWPGNPVNRRYRLLGRDYEAFFSGAPRGHS
jgi:hypothetical protein